MYIGFSLSLTRAHIEQITDCHRYLNYCAISNKTTLSLDCCNTLYLSCSIGMQLSLTKFLMELCSPYSCSVFAEPAEMSKVDELVNTQNPLHTDFDQNRHQSVAQISDNMQNIVTT